jgi:hypothetical protein
MSSLALAPQIRQTRASSAAKWRSPLLIFGNICMRSTSQPESGYARLRRRLEHSAMPRELSNTPFCDGPTNCVGSAIRERALFAHSALPRADEVPPPTPYAPTILLKA